MTSDLPADSPLDPVLAAVAARFPQEEGARMVDGSPEAARAAIDATTATCRPGPDIAEIHDTVVPGGPPVRVYDPDRPEPGVTVHFHGGGWVTGGLDYADAHCRLLVSATGRRVVSVDYRLAPEHPFPAAVEDARAAVRWAAGSADGGGPVPLVLCGDSAGGNLAAVSTAALMRDAGGSGPVVGQALVYPIVDADAARDSYARRSTPFLGAEDMRWFLGHYCPDPARRSDPRFSPLCDEEAIAACPPTVVAVGGHDPLRDEGIAYADALAAAGADVRLLDFPALPHAYLQFTAVCDAAAAAQDRIVEAVSGLWAGTGSAR